MKILFILLLVFAAGFVGWRQRQQIQALETELATSKESVAHLEEQLAQAQRVIAANAAARPPVAGAVPPPPPTAAVPTPVPKGSWMWEKPRTNSLDRKTPAH